MTTESALAKLKQMPPSVAAASVTVELRALVKRLRAEAKR